MDDNIKILIISAVVTALGSLFTVLTTKWIEVHQKRNGVIDETTGQIAIRRFDQEETIRKEMQVKLDHMERTLNRHERAFGHLRDTISDLLRETLMTMQLAMHDIRSGHPDDALKKLEDGVLRLKQIKLPELPSVDEPQNKRE